MPIADLRVNVPGADALQIPPGSAWSVVRWAMATTSAPAALRATWRKNLGKKNLASWRRQRGVRSNPSYTYLHYSSRPEAPQVPPRAINMFAGGSGPLGVYCYQSDARATFGATRPYVFELTPTVPVTYTAKYTEARLEVDLHFLRRIVSIDRPLRLYTKWLKKAGRPGPPFHKLWYVISRIPNELTGDGPGAEGEGFGDPKRGRELFVELGHKIIDDRYGIMYASEPEQAVFLTDDSFTARQVPKPNPYVGTHPDLLPPEHRHPRDGALKVPPGRGATAAFAKHHEIDGISESTPTPVFVPLSDLTSDQIRAMKRAQFTDDEWDELDSDDREYIEENDEESQERVDDLAKPFIERWKWEKEPPDRRYIFERVEDSFEYWLRDRAGSDSLFEESPPRVDDALEEYARERRIDPSDVQFVLNQYLADQNNYTFSAEEPSERGDWGRVWYEEYQGYFYIEKSDFEDEMAVCTPDEIERAVEKINDETENDLDLKVKDLERTYGVERNFDTGIEIGAWVNWDHCVDACKGMLDEIEGSGDLPDDADPEDVPEDRVVHRWPDGFYVQDLIPSELPAEGKAMGMCVGRPDMGYGKAVRQGEIKILSLRRPSGKPLFTFEVGLAQGTPDAWVPLRARMIAEVEQIKGKANRLPGFDLGKTAAPIKRDEVARVYDFVEGAATKGYFAELAVDDIRDMKPAVEQVNALYRQGDKWAVKLLHDLGIESDATIRPRETEPEEPRQNPGAACGLHDEKCAGFCRPYRSRRR